MEKAICDLYPLAIKDERKRDSYELFKLFPSLTTFEYSFLRDIPNEKAEEELNQLAEQNFLVSKSNNTGTIWKQVAAGIHLN